MAEIIYIVGKPGSGKTYGYRTLNPDETLIVNADYKSLTFKGGKKGYNKEKKNYFEESNPDNVTKIIEGASKAQKNGKHIFKNIIIDTANAIMNDMEMKFHEGGKVSTMTQGEWYELAKYIYGMIKPMQRMERDDLYIFILFHEGSDDEGTKAVLTNGRKLEKIQLEGLVNWCFFTKVEGDKYELETRNVGMSRAKRKADAFPDVIENDYALIVKGIEKFEKDE